MAITEHGAPRQLISDNAMQFSSRHGHKPVHFQHRLAAMGIRQLSSRPAHPQTYGKLERYHRTCTDFYADHGPAATIDEPQELCDRCRWHHNHQRPSLGQQLPAKVYQALPKGGTRRSAAAARLSPVHTCQFTAVPLMFPRNPRWLRENVRDLFRPDQAHRSIRCAPLTFW